MTDRNYSDVISRWASLGAMFNAPPSKEAPNIERLLIDTAGQLDQNARLLLMTVTWLEQFHTKVLWDQLADLAAGLQGRQSARMGLLTDMGQQHIHDKAIQTVIDACTPMETPEPLSAVERKRPALAALARKRASEISKKWGLWTQSIDRLKSGAIRPAVWIARRNPTFALRGMLKGHIAVRAIVALAEQSMQNVSETQLTRHVGCTRKAMHSALDDLENSGWITRKQLGKRYAINLSETLAQ
jgi:hypothetical protein